MKIEDCRNESVIMLPRSHGGGENTVQLIWGRGRHFFILWEDEQTCERGRHFSGNVEKEQTFPKSHRREEDTVQVPRGGACTFQVMWESSRHCPCTWGGECTIYICGRRLDTTQATWEKEWIGRGNLLLCIRLPRPLPSTLWQDVGNNFGRFEIK